MISVPPPTDTITISKTLGFLGGIIGVILASVVFLQVASFDIGQLLGFLGILVFGGGALFAWSSMKLTLLLTQKWQDQHWYRWWCMLISMIVSFSLVGVFVLYIMQFAYKSPASW